MEQTVNIPTRLALLIARYLAVKADFARSVGYKREADMVDVWKNDLIDAVADQCTTEEFEAAAVAVKLEEGTY